MLAGVPFLLDSSSPFLLGLSFIIYPHFLILQPLPHASGLCDECSVARSHTHEHSGCIKHGGAVVQL